ncbi:MULTISPECIES: hypothetical protein [Pseudoalteromonas]|uniref:hypothetical protein n=1 Tax=Pseudoalteromonas TaxID=53246 RepID=UPI001581C03A|nr:MULTISPECIES: hypothetical protein [Pseudoalteromonas]MDI4653101.1 hypothetical protein [Pseudoalteromonas shioyasakiensis]NUJ39195.1 hypothetical protein [Pseudoalteromonas sp. 0303]
MPLTPDHILKEREETIKNSVTGCEFFQLKVGWPVSSDSAHFELIQEGSGSFVELINILECNAHLRKVTIWIAGGKLLKATKHKKRLFWFGGENISKQKAKEILSIAKLRK